MTGLLIDQVRNVNPALMKGKGPTARMQTRKKIKVNVRLGAEMQAQGYRARVQKGKGNA